MTRQRFGTFEFDRHALELRKSGRLIAVRPQPLQVLAVLLDRPGELVTREDLQRALWDRETFVDFDQGLNHAVRELRAALGDLAGSPRFIETLPRRGYRFVAPLLPEAPAVADLPPIGPTIAVEAAGPAPAPLVRPPSHAGRWVFVAGAIAAVAAAVALVWRPPVAPPEVAGTVIVVRAFAGAGDDRVSGIGLSQAIAARLGGQRLLAIRTNRQDEAIEPGALVLDGEMAVSNDEVTATARLLDAAGHVRWSERIGVRAAQVYDVEAVIAERVAAALRLQLAVGEQARLRRRYTSNAAAYASYLAGRAALVQYTPAGARAAVGAFETALQSDPAYSLARAGLAMACADQYLRYAPPAELEHWAERAETEARAALALDPDLPEAHLARAMVARKREFDWTVAIESSQRALVLNPNLAQAHLIIAAAFYHLGYMEDAGLALDLGRRLRGDDVIEPVRIDGLIALFSGRMAPALAHLEEVSRLSSDVIGDTYLALARFYSGYGERSREALERLSDHRSASTAARARAALAGVLAAQGATDSARDALRRVLSQPYRDHHVAYGIGAAYAQLGDMANAVDWLEIAADTGFPCAPWFLADPLLSPLRATPAFPALLAHVETRRHASRPTAP